MPFYTFEHPETGEIKNILQKINDKHVYEEKGIQWKRIFSAPMAIVGGKVEAWHKNKTINNK